MDCFPLELQYQLNQDDLDVDVSMWKN